MWHRLANQNSPSLLVTLLDCKWGHGLTWANQSLLWGSLGGNSKDCKSPKLLEPSYPTALKTPSARLSQHTRKQAKGMRDRALTTGSGLSLWTQPCTVSSHTCQLHALGLCLQTVSDTYNRKYPNTNALSLQLFHCDGLHSCPRFFTPLCANALCHMTSELSPSRQSILTTLWFFKAESCDLLWSIECSKGDSMPNPSLGLKKPGVFLLALVNCSPRHEEDLHVKPTSTNF